MKQILPILTLTTLTAAAFADAGAAAPAAAASGLSYNRVSFSRNSTSNNVSIDHLIGGGNVLVGLAVAGSNSGRSNQLGNSDGSTFKLGYVFKNVAYGVDATAELLQSQWDAPTWGVKLRRPLNEIVSGLEISVGYHTVKGNKTAWSYASIDGASAGQENGSHSVNYELAYNINKQYTVSYGFMDWGAGVNANSGQHIFSLRYNY